VALRALGGRPGTNSGRVTSAPLIGRDGALRRPRPKSEAEGGTSVLRRVSHSPFRRPAPSGTALGDGDIAARCPCLSRLGHYPCIRDAARAPIIKFSLSCSTNGLVGSTSGIKSDRSPISQLGKLFFRHQAPWQQRRNMTILCWLLFVTLLIGCVTVGLMFFANTRH
jgi:hypothetical protein